MTERGVFAISRGIWKDLDFKPAPFTEIQAFIWLVSEAAWKPHKVRGPRHPVELKRGEVSHSIRFMAGAWGWPKSRVARFLEKLKNRDIIRDTSRDGLHIYFLRNYNKFQVIGLPDRDNNGGDGGTTAGQQRDKLESGESGEIGGGEGARACDARTREGRPDASALAKSLLDAGGATLDQNSPHIQLMTEPARWLESGYDLAYDVLPVVRAESRAAAARGESIRSWRFFTAAIIREAQRGKQPLPRAIPGGRSALRGKAHYLDVLDELDAQFAQAEREPGHESGSIIDAEFRAASGRDSGD